MVELIYSGPRYSVEQYAGQGYDLHNKEEGRGIFLSGLAASQFKHALDGVQAMPDTDDAMNWLVGSFDAVMNQPLVTH